MAQQTQNANFYQNRARIHTPRMLSFLQTFSSSFWSVNCRVGSFSGWNWQKPEESKKRRRRGLFFPTFLRLLWPLVVEPSRRESDLKLNTDRAALCYGNNLETQHHSKNCRFFCGRVHVGARTHTHTHTICSCRSFKSPLISQCSIQNFNCVAGRGICFFFSFSFFPYFESRVSPSLMLVRPM